MQEIEFYLPAGEIWYNYQSKTIEPITGRWVNRELTDSQQGLFILGGTTIALLKHDDCLALLACFFNPIHLEVYLDADGNSSGQLYLDDGESYDFSRGQRAYIDFLFEDNTLSSTRSEMNYSIPAT